ncbi:Nucleotide-binding universal stress protein, UspA family [Neorhodopirellula lusitana]|uniref:Nucleotide-binding universal stress protein, UspA family n=1 Tax=Neorhodopirellula lusitana TaxID=445327 RepID=A0ABY1PQW2_9BACT|nr:universal stress protein [Neorhodopirellula lusitana]SMP42725.1 Nucleotide-binding universal stress protein, UspA family [Neorhodopirellula lusitana]
MRVLLANDATPHSHAAADYLLAMPFRKPIDLDIASAVTPPILVDGGMVGMPIDMSDFVEEERQVAKARVDQTAADFRDGARGKSLHSVSTHVPVGPPPSEVLNLADQTNCDLIVMGAVGHSALERVLLGSVSDYVATHSDVSTLVVRPNRDSEIPPSLKKIVIALSGSAEDQRMIDWLGNLHLRSSVEIHLVRILRLESFYRQDIRQKATEYWAMFVKHAQQQILDLESQLQSMDLNTETHLVESDHVGEALIDYAETHGCDLVMTGDSDSGLLTRIFMGSTSRYVLRHARCSVLVVRDKGERAKARQELAEQRQAAIV